jgi:hypothetical protein
MSITMVERREMGNSLTHRFGCQIGVTVTHGSHMLLERRAMQTEGGFWGFVNDQGKGGLDSP